MLTLRVRLAWKQLSQVNIDCSFDPCSIKRECWNSNLTTALHHHPQSISVREAKFIMSFSKRFPDQKLQSRFEQVGVSKLVWSHLQLRHLILLSWTKEPEVYPVISPPWKQIKSPFNQSNRSIKNCPKYLFTTACATDLILTTISKMEEDVMIPWHQFFFNRRRATD